jgi:hypothetical protein
MDMPAEIFSPKYVVRKGQSVLSILAVKIFSSHTLLSECLLEISSRCGHCDQLHKNYSLVHLYLEYLRTAFPTRNFKPLLCAPRPSVHIIKNLAFV